MAFWGPTWRQEGEREGGLSTLTELPSSAIFEWVLVSGIRWESEKLWNITLEMVDLLIDWFPN